MDIEAARTVARETVNETFMALGVDLRVPGEAVSVQKDFAWLRETRTARQSNRSWVRRSVYGGIITLVVTVAGGFLVKVVTGVAGEPVNQQEKISGQHQENGKLPR